ncbi:MAG: hypothetical protein LBM76_03375 [Mycoplasmataceae bacterium]|jgi:hypothetical protein|nr:hypothetical protein [Mycoplasmataceae bacterium]
MIINATAKYVYEALEAFADEMPSPFKKVKQISESVFQITAKTIFLGPLVVFRIEISEVDDLRTSVLRVKNGFFHPENASPVAERERVKCLDVLLTYLEKYLAKINKLTNNAKTVNINHNTTNNIIQNRSPVELKELLLDAMDLYKAGVITKKDYETQKAQIMKEISKSGN